ncbi:hypothetical protein MTO96_016564 [Rhipicephalus appendiculatus]|uniref:Zinc finger CCHC domain-containing protein 7 n=1 Tax=Rhipicephalus appendiculatus TaxID=34631 RepID=A0A131Z637_RHIAP
MWDDDDYSHSCRESDSDDLDSDLESYLYSTLHYSTGEESVAPKASLVADESDEGDLTVLDVVTPKIRNAGSCAVSAEELKCISKRPKRKKRRLTAAACEEPGPSTAPEGRDVIVLSSDDDDEVIIFDEDSQQNLALNVTETPRSRGAESDLWHVDAEDLYRNSRGFRYHNKEKAHCRKCDQMGHVAKFCRKKKFKVCFCCSDMGHDGARCPKRMCSRCYEQGHTVAECKETDVPSCTICYTKGHPGSLCPDLWRRYHMTTDDGPIVRVQLKTRPPEERYCYNCARQGHYGHQCQQKKRGRPSTPFVVSYKDLYHPEPPPLVLRDAKRLYRANNKRKRKNERMKGLRVVQCNGQAAQNGEQAGFHDQQTSQPDVVAVEDAAPPESNCSGEQVSEDAAPSAKRRKKSRMQTPNTMSKQALRRKRVREKNKQKKLSREIKRKLFQGEEAKKTSVFDNTTFYIPNRRYYQTYWDHN